MTTADVSLRGFQIAQGAEVSERDGVAFLSLEQPPPVRSVLELTVDGARKALEVVSVDESGRGGHGSGCTGRWVDVDALDRALGQVGSEGLATGSGDDGGSRARNAPVVVTDEPSGVIDMNTEPPPDDDDAATDDDASDDEASNGDADGEADEETSNGAKKGKRTKKRKGRKRG